MGTTMADLAGALHSFDRAGLTEVETVERSLPVVCHGGTPGPRKPTRAEAEALAAAKILDAQPQEMHGSLGAGAGWAPPRMVAYADVEARPGYDSCKAHEYVDAPGTLAAKVKVLAAMVRAARRCVAYTGAGISTAAGINDYASVAAGSHAAAGGGQQAQRVMSPMDLAPTEAHRVLVALHAAGLMHGWVQQNHDGLPQKAGLPQAALNEIHGAWFDPSNPVVRMSGELRGDLFADLLREEARADLCLALGTSLAGMNADRLPATVARRAAAAHGADAGAADARRSLLAGGAPAGGGTVVVSLQQTKLDGDCQLRIFGTIDAVMAALAEELGLTPAAAPSFVPAVDAPADADVFEVPYGSDGLRLPAGAAPRRLDLRAGARLRITAGPYEGDEGEVVGVSRLGHHQIRFLHTVRGSFKAPMTHTLGRWFAAEAAAGTLVHLPVEAAGPVEAGGSEQEVLAREEVAALQHGGLAGAAAAAGSRAAARERAEAAAGLPDWVREAYRSKRERTPGGDAE